MIELKNIQKTYKSKRSKNTKALDGITLNFDEKGITFILGKSGSGKSTLLNILGGLDKYDAGDMVILGKSSKDFTQADFDSYRNTYIGFIFQEFNILEDYDVYENIALALQLQQKDINEKEINELLEKLELTELKKRKVNELSGGQKQRVAIARALIKNPKIILADEPTGNLDSKTGRQVMELLKEIAKEKLVIIVSHDEEYAEKYGDRIIEIKDGQVVRDTKEVKTNKATPNTYQTIKSKLPLKDSFKLGIGSLKHKKIKLFFTILLTVITLGFLSCTDTLSSYNYKVEHAKLLADKKEQFIQIENYHLFTSGNMYNKLLIEMDSNAVADIQNKIGKEGYDVYHYNNDYSSSMPRDILRIQDNGGYFYSSSDDVYAEIVVSSDISKIIKEDIIGRSPTAKNEIVISNLVADKMIEYGVEVYENVVEDEFKVSNIFEPKNYEEILNTQYTYHFGEAGKVKIVGIINYEETNKSKPNLTNKIYVSDSFIPNLEVSEQEGIKSYFSHEFEIEGVEKDHDYTITEPVILNHEIEYFDGTEWKKVNSLKDNEVILTIEEVVESMNYQEELNDYLNRNGNYWEDYDRLRKRFFENYVNNLNVIGKKASLKINYDMTYDDLKDVYREYENLIVIGIYMEDENSWGRNNYFSEEILKDVKQEPFEKTSILYPMTSRKDFENVIKKFPLDSNLSVKSTYSERVQTENYMFNTLKKVAFYVGIAFLVFAVILITNFMITSISYRKKEIGVLRALGSRSKDVMKIFLWEGIGMSFLSGTVASILLVIVTNYLNVFIKSRMSILTTPFLVGIRQVIVIYVLVFLVTMIASIIPILKISRMKPIDAILNK